MHRTKTPQKIQPDETTDKINKLTLAKKNALKKYDYEKAKEIGEQIKQLELEAQKAKLDSLYELFQDEVNGIIERSTELISTITKNSEDNEKEIRKSFNSRFDALKKKHRSELISLEKRYEDERLKQTSTRVPEYDALLAESKRHADNENWDLAIQKRDEARKITQTVIAERLEAAELQFVQERDSLLAKFGNDLDDLSQRLRESLDENAQKQIISNQDAVCSRDDKLAQLIGTTTQRITSEHPLLKPEEVTEKLQEMMGDILQSHNLSIPDW